MATCFHHKDRETYRACTRCDRPACPDCLRDAAVGSHCFECVKAAAPSRQERARRWNSTAPLIATQALIAINVAIWIGMFLYSRSHPDTNSDPFGLSIGIYAYALREDHEYWRIISAGFLHFGIFHLAMNCWALYNLGSLTERIYGRVSFLALYFSAMAAGSLGALVLSPNSLTGGASGAIFGLLGASVMEMKSRGVPFMQSPLAGMLLINLVITFQISGISIGGHVGGLAGGLIVGWAFAQRHDPRIKLFRWAVPLVLFVVATVGCIIVANSTAPIYG